MTPHQANQFYTNSTIKSKLLLKLITHSYDMVLNNMSKKQRAQLDENL